MARRRSAKRHHHLTSRQRRARHAAKIAAMPQEPTPQEMEEIDNRLKRKLDRIAISLGNEPAWPELLPDSSPHKSRWCSPEE